MNARQERVCRAFALADFVGRFVLAVERSDPKHPLAEWEPLLKAHFEKIGLASAQVGALQEKLNEARANVNPTEFAELLLKMRAELEKEVEELTHKEIF